jgi:A/G-specific adenine glycosylase
MARKFQDKKLLAWFKKNQRKLPWRKNYNPYWVWVSEVMLQQTQVEQALPYFERFLKKFPTIKSLASSKEQTVLKAWEGLGYYSRARNLHKAAQQVVEKYRSQLPEEKAELEKLPGLGPYMAAAVASIAFKKDEALVDGNVVRVLSRFYGSKKTTQDREYFLDVARKILPKGKARSFNQALMELGALVCVPKNPLCAKCPLRENCFAFEKGVQEKFPIKVKKKKVPTKVFAAVIVKDDGGYLMRQRTHQGLLANMWEFPMIEMQSFGLPLKRLERVLESEFGVAVYLEKELGIIKHSYTHFKQVVQIYTAKTAWKPKTMHVVNTVKLKRLPLSKVNHKILDIIQEKNK